MGRVLKQIHSDQLAKAGRLAFGTTLRFLVMIRFRHAAPPGIVREHSASASTKQSIRSGELRRVKVAWPERHAPSPKQVRKCATQIVEAAAVPLTVPALPSAVSFRIAVVSIKFKTVKADNSCRSSAIFIFPHSVLRKTIVK